MVLKEEGKVDLDAKISTYLPPATIADIAKAVKAILEEISKTGSWW
jgi:CubicO group peptidase (beta-lactamase class C family)